MIVPNHKRRRAAKTKIKDCVENPGAYGVIHYSCESFNDRPNGLSPRITSIAILEFATYQVTSFSIHLVAERSGIDVQHISAHYDELELRMLKEFFNHLKSYRDRRYVHWNMRDVGYGFEAIQHRFLALGGSRDDLFVLDHDKKVDLAMMLKDIYGDDYIGHPRMERLLEKNEKTPRFFLTGAEEASAFEKGEYFRLHQSTLGKVHAFADITRLASDRKLSTNATWWVQHGGSVRSMLDWAGNHPRLSLASFAITVAGLAVTIFALL